MQIKPVTKADKPEYPAASEIDIPKVLNASKPKKWKRNATIGAVMLGMIITPSCKRVPINVKSRYEHGIEQNNYKFVAPLFEHGKGIGYLGCTMVIPPMFISESDAKRIIVSEFNNAGIDLDSNLVLASYPKINTIVHRPLRYMYISDFENMTWEDFNLPITKSPNYVPGSGDSVYSFPLKYDAYSRKLNLAIVFVSREKYNTFIDDTVEINSSAGPFNVKKIAEKIIKNVSNIPNSIAVFYDPVYYLPRNYFDPFKDLPKYLTKNLDNNNNFNLKYVYREKIRRNNAKDSLKAQVRDFIYWYKNQQLWW